MKNKKNTKNKTLIILALILATLLIGWFGLRSPYFNLKNITVAGNKNLNKDQVLKSSQLSKNQNIFRSNTLRAKKNIAKNPYVEKIEITRKLPDTINIVLEEIDEAYQILNLDKSYIILDESGNILNYRKNPSKDITIIKGLKFTKKISEKSIGENIENFGKNDKIFRFLNANSKINLQKELKEINFSQDTINISLKNNRQVKFGGFKDYDYKLSLLKEILKKTSEDKISYETIFMDRGENPIIVTDSESL